MYQGEKLNSISHLIGAVLALVGLGALVSQGMALGDPWALAGFSIFGITLVLLYVMSTLYHSFPFAGVKQLFKLFDHIAIYLLIAGTYTPLMLVIARDTSGPWILAAVWGMAFVGILSEIFLRGRAVKVMQMVLYLGMGWIGAIDLGTIKAAMPEMGGNLLVWGGLAYTIGVAFYVADKAHLMRHAHGIWHFFVLAGSLFHFFMVLLYVR
jgi:hemolysin III